MSIGISIGNSYSSVGIANNSQITIIPNSVGNLTTPTCISLSDELLVGDSAKNSMNSDTISNIRSLIQTSQDQTVMNKLSVEELIIILLSDLKKTAESFKQTEITEAVLTVPVHFNDFQRTIMKNAAEKTGFTDYKLINEPTAACIAYGISGNAVVVDFGATQLTVSIVNMDEGVAEIIGSNCKQIGGDLIDQLLFEHVAQKFFSLHKKDIKNNERATRRLKRMCQRAKHCLSSSQTAQIELDCICDGIDLNQSIKLETFNTICDEILKQIVQFVEQTVKEAGIEKDKIQHVVLAGGSCKIPKVKKLLSEYFNSKQLLCSINPDEVMAYGAAIQAKKIFHSEEILPKLLEEDNIVTKLTEEVVKQEVLEQVEEVKSSSGGKCSKLTFIGLIVLISSALLINFNQ
ncbi:Cytosolic_heat shock protein 70 [Hexamita inflata]|uniref:Cytosolic heat shock protein 70 n=1 Tax=Hexamita inflata TaxID=28002 RepID=A0AA86PFM5_9EUKA|nr:Cytosolic heat shock protein 70 [Hexamita inflata]